MADQVGRCVRFPNSAPGNVPVSGAIIYLRRKTQTHLQERGRGKEREKEKVLQEQHPRRGEGEEGRWAGKPCGRPARHGS